MGKSTTLTFPFTPLTRQVAYWFLLISNLGDPLSPEGLQHLKSYKYSSVDKSPVSYYLLRPYWNFCVELLPLWLAPNAVTLLGFGFIFANVMILQFCIPDLMGPGPSWVYYSFAIGLWAYSTLDNIDGKQARRTGTSSPLGELFDHGIDALNCTLASLGEATAMGFGSTQIGAFTALIPCLPMFFSTWETYHTHTLYLGYVNGPTEGLMMACVVMLVSGWFGPQVWYRPMSDLVGCEDVLGGTTLVDIWVPVVIFALVAVHVPFCVYNVVEARRKNGLPILPVFLEWAPVMAFTGSCAAWLGSPYSSLLKNDHLLLFSMTMSPVIGRLTTKIILHHLTRQPFPFWTIMLWPLLGGAVLANLPRFGLPAVDPDLEAWYLWGYFIFAQVAYFRWAALVIDKFCAFLDINCLTIKRKDVDLKGSNGVYDEANGTVHAAKKDL